MSPGMAVALGPISVTALSRSAWRRPVMKTRAPSAANRLATPSPMPALPPVTTAVLPFSLLLMVVILLDERRADRATEQPLAVSITRRSIA